MNCKLHAVYDGTGRPRVLLLTEGHLSDHQGAAVLLPFRPPARILIGDKGYKLRHRIEDMFAKFKDWRRIAPRSDRCAHTFFSALCLAATIIFWIN